MSTINAWRLRPLVYPLPGHQRRRFLEASRQGSFYDQREGKKGQKFYSRATSIKISNMQSKEEAAKKLEALRKEMQKAKVAAFVVPSADPHLLEYAPERFQRRAFISGFTGSAGTAVVTDDQAALWTDGRYHLQAEQQLTKDWKLMKAGVGDCPEVSKWLGMTLKPGTNVGIDPFCHSEKESEKLKKDLAEKHVGVVGIERNLVDLVWGDRIPQEPVQSIFVHPVEIAGETVESKLERIRNEMHKVDASLLLVSKLEEIAWTLNLRGHDEPYSPIFISYLLVSGDTVELFIDLEKISKEVRSYLEKLKIKIASYDKTAEALKTKLRASPESKLWMDPDLVSHAMFQAAREVLGDQTEKRLVQETTPLTGFMAVKNDRELDGMREAHVRDGVAIVEFLAWLEKEIASGRTLTEVEVDEKLTAWRAKQKGFKGLSFPTIAGANANGAIIHYKPEKDTCGTVDRDTMLLIDSGGQYDCGTTDITRTIHMGTPTAFQKLCNTRVLQGHIALATVIFPKETPGIAIDAFARRPLWDLGLQYLHGTGHGVGAYMCVHEGPIQVTFRGSYRASRESLKENMIISNEPGYYERGQFGTRIENLCIIKKQDTQHSFDQLPFYGLETITMVPIQKKLINTDDLTQLEIEWLNKYHQEVLEKLKDKVSPEALAWLVENTLPL